MSKFPSLAHPVFRYLPAMRSIFLLCYFLAVGPLLDAQETAQPTLPAVTLSVGDKTVTAEVADEPIERMTGLMFREKLAPDSGMLFVMSRPDQVSFYMKNTLIPLSIAYISPTGVILEIHDLQPKNETPVPSVFKNIAYALEMDQGWFNDHKILPGDRIRGLPPLTGR